MMKNKTNFKLLIFFFICFSCSTLHERHSERIFYNVKCSYLECVYDKIDSSIVTNFPGYNRERHVSFLESEFSFFKIEKISYVLDSLSHHSLIKNEIDCVFISFFYPGVLFDPEDGYDVGFYLVGDSLKTNISVAGSYDCYEEKLEFKYELTKDVNEIIHRIKNVKEDWGLGYLFLLEFTSDWQFVDCYMALGLEGYGAFSQGS